MTPTHHETRPLDALREHPFAAAARRAVARVVLARWFALLGRTAAVLVAVGATLLAAREYGGLPIDPPLIWLLPVVWLAGTAAWAWLRRPTAVAALALWDERAGRHEMFASAYCFEGAPSHEAGEKLHLERARGVLGDEIQRLRRDLPARLPHRAWLAPLALAALLLAAGWLRAPLAAEDLPLDDDARARAAEVADTLAEQAKELDPLAGLSDEEREKLEQLKTALDETGQKLEMLKGETPREVLSELERRALEAEKLAEALGAGAAAELSSDMIAELERHADTADLAAALRAQDMEQIAEEIENLAKRLRRKNLPLEEEERIASAIDQAMQRANRRDLQSLLGREFSRVNEELRNSQRQRASQQLSNLARQFSQLAQRQQSQRRLQQLARQLRNSGQRISGGSQALRRLAQAPASRGGLQPLRGTPRPFNVSARFNPNARPMTGQPRQGQGQCQGGQCPVPGTGQCQGGGQGAGAQAGAPVPGAGRGGLRAGRGSAAHSRNPTAALPGGETRVVNVDPTGEGPSELQEIEGAEREEGTSRDAQAIAIETIQAEEEALSAEPLPVSRREQVLRYFTALRSQLEQPPADDVPADDADDAADE